MKIIDNTGGFQTVELKAITGKDFKNVVLDWYCPNKTTKKSKEERIKERKDIPILFLSYIQYYNIGIGKTNKCKHNFLQSKTLQINEDWLVGIIKRT